jgi:hypothetical protein
MHVYLVTYLQNDLAKAYTILYIYNDVRNSPEIRKIVEKVQVPDLYNVVYYPMN